MFAESTRVPTLPDPVPTPREVAASEPAHLGDVEDDSSRRLAIAAEHETDVAKASPQAASDVPAQAREVDPRLARLERLYAQYAESGETSWDHERSDRALDVTLASIAALLDLQGRAQPVPLGERVPISVSSKGQRRFTAFGNVYLFNAEEFPEYDSLLKVRRSLRSNAPLESQEALQSRLVPDLAAGIDALVGRAVSALSSK